MKKFITFLLLTFSAFYANATGAYALYEFNSSAFVVSSNRTEVRSIASITKLFTAVAVLNSGVDLTEKVKINGKSGGKVPAGVFMSRYDLMQAMLISSDNRAAETLANHHPGGFQSFIKDINQYIEKHSLLNTTIVDSTGLDRGNVSSVGDLIEFLSLIKHNTTIRAIAGERNAAINAPKGKKNIKINIHNTNPEIFVYDNILISKTGFTSPAGRCVIMLVEKSKELYGVVVLGQTNVRNRSIIVKDLLNVDLPKSPNIKINGTVEFDYSNSLP
jgi:D-alanyl-D-alanine endopeptidase (penicillin-binding protein 7)